MKNGQRQINVNLGENGLNSCRLQPAQRVE